MIINLTREHVWKEDNPYVNDGLLGLYDLVMYHACADYRKHILEIGLEECWLTAGRINREVIMGRIIAARLTWDEWLSVMSQLPVPIESISWQQIRTMAASMGIKEKGEIEITWEIAQ